MTAAALIDLIFIAIDGKKLDQEKLLDFLKSVRVTENGTTLELTDGNVRFEIPIQQIKLANGNNEWRLGQCELVKAIINRIAVKEVQGKGEGGDSVAPN